MPLFKISFLTVDKDELNVSMLDAVDRADVIKQLLQLCTLRADFKRKYNDCYEVSIMKTDNIFAANEVIESKAIFKLAGKNLKLTAKQTEACWLKSKGLSILEIADKLKIVGGSVNERLTNAKNTLQLEHVKDIVPKISAEIKKIIRLQKKLPPPDL